jgi:hypothetical protein
MSNPRYAYAFALSLGCALGGCIDAVDDTADTAVAEQAIFHNEVRLRRIQADILYEDGDEIYLDASQSAGGSVNVIRPSGDPDYFRFDTPHATPLNMHVGTIVPDSLLIVNMWEQEFGADHEIGTIDFDLNYLGNPKTWDTPTGKSLGIDPNNGWFKVRFSNGARYYAWFEVGP